MPKKILADMVPGKQIRRINKARLEALKTEVPKEEIRTVKTQVSNIETITTPKRSKTSFLDELPTIKHESVYKYDEHFGDADAKDLKDNKSSKYGLWFLAFVAIVFLFFAFSNIFAKAKITVDPKIQELALNQNFSAFKDTNSEGVLPFSLVSLSGEETKLIPSSEEKEAVQTAKGKVILYNNFSVTPQRLAKDTRLIGTNDKIYKTETEITVPGMTKANLQKGIKENIPGSVEVAIYANESGEEYNSSPMDFKILGFKGTPKYETFFGRSKGSITGGIKGKFNFISEEDKIKAESELKAVLEEKLLQKITEGIPEGYILFKNAVVFKIDERNINLFSADKEVPLLLSGTLYGFLFEEKSLTQKIVENLVMDYDGSEVYIPNIKDLNFTATIPIGVISYLNIKDLDFTLSGTPKIIWRVDEEKLRNSLLARSKKEFQQVLTEFPNIEKANLTLRPVWRSSVPDKSKDIKILVNYE